MEACHYLASFILLIFIPGFSTEDTVFVKTGASVQLNIQRDKLPDEFDEIFWQNEKSDTIVKYYNELKKVRYYDDYKDRVDFNTESFSLTLKNMKKTDSGVYTAKTTGKINRDVAEHRVSVIGFSTEDTVFVQTGASVQLNIQRDKLPDEFDDIVWQNEKSDTIVKYYIQFKAVKVYHDYKDRVDFNTESFSLTLKNMKKTDSVVYTAKTTGTLNRDVAVHRVSVIDPVKTPELTVISNWSSSDSCTVNFTCRAHDLTLNSIYNNDSCSPEEVTSHEKFTIILICSNETIICNHSNPISWKTERIDITQLCKVHPENLHQPNNFITPIWMVVCIVVVLVVAVVVGFVFLSRCRKRNFKAQDAAGETSTIFIQQ